MKIPRLRITGFSTALYATWFFVDDLALLLDCGDGACAGLLEKSRKVRTIAISHSDRDHLGGLAQFLQVNVRDAGLPVVLHPRDCDSFPRLERFLHEFDRFHLDRGDANCWQGVGPGSEIDLGKAGCHLVPFSNRHIDSEPDQIKSLSYRVVQQNHHLKERFQGCSSQEIAALREKLGDDEVIDREWETLLVYSADTPIEPPSFWGTTRLLIHESTFLHTEDARMRTQDLRHSALDQVIPMAVELEPEVLLLSHFSTRYSRAEIRSAIARECQRCRPRFPVHALFPGELRRDILAEAPEWSP